MATPSPTSQTNVLLRYSPTALARLAQGTSLTISILLAIPDAVALIPNSPSLLSWLLRLIGVWLSAMILWFVAFLGLLHAVRWLGKGISIEPTGIRLWRFGRFIPWQSIAAVAVEPQPTFSRLFCLKPVAERMTLFITGKKPGTYFPQYIPSFLFSEEDFAQLFGTIASVRFGVAPDCRNVVLTSLEQHPGVDTLHKFLAWQRVALSLVIALGLTLFLGRKAVVHYLYSAGNGEFNRHNYAAARKDFQQVTSMDPAFAVAWHNLAGAEFQLGDWYNAREHWHKALFLKPDLVDAKVSLSYIYLQHRQFDQAQELLDSALRFAPHNEGALTNLADLQMRLGHTREAMKTCREILLCDPNNKLANCLLAQGRIRLGKYKEALQLLDRVDKSSGDGDSFCLLVKAQAYLACGQGEKAQPLLQQVLQLLPNNIEALMGLARVYMDKGQAAKALPLATRAEAIGGYSPWPWLVEAEVDRRLQRTDHAMRALESALRQKNQDALSLAQAATLAYQLKDYKSAVALAKQAMRIEPVTPEALSVLRAVHEGPPAG